MFDVCRRLPKGELVGQTCETLEQDAHLRAHSPRSIRAAACLVTHTRRNDVEQVAGENGVVPGGEEEAGGLWVERRPRSLVEEGIERFAGTLGCLDDRPAGRVDAGQGLEAEDPVERALQVRDHHAVKAGDALCELAPRPTRPEQEPCDDADRRTNGQVLDPDESYLPPRR